MADFNRMAFDPEAGLEDSSLFETTPATEARAREQVQTPLNQLRDFINNEVINVLENAESGQSGAEHIGSKPIGSLPGDTVWAQLDNLKAQLTSAAAANFTAGIIDDPDYFTNGVVTGEKIKNGAIGAGHYADASISNIHLVDGTIEGGKIHHDTIGQDHYMDASIHEDHIAAGAVTETKLGTGAVTGTKIANGSVAKQKLGTIDYITLGTGASLAYNGDYQFLGLTTPTGGMRVMPSLVVSNSDPSGDYPEGTLWLKV